MLHWFFGKPFNRNVKERETIINSKLVEKGIKIGEENNGYTNKSL
jgi:hypothetical protein